MSGGLASPWLTIRVQFVLAAFFVVAGFAKIADPPGFAHEIHNYGIVPGVAVNAMALVLPWLEVVTGLALFFGIAKRTVDAHPRDPAPGLHRRAGDQPRSRQGRSTAAASASPRSRRRTPSGSST